MKLICWLFLGTLAFGQTKVVNCHGPVEVFTQDGSHSFHVKCGAKVKVVYADSDWTQIQAGKQGGLIATYFLTKPKKQKAPLNWQPAIDGLKSGTKIAETVPKQQPAHIPLCYNGGRGEIPGQ